MRFRNQRNPNPRNANPVDAVPRVKDWSNDLPPVPDEPSRTDAAHESPRFDHDPDASANASVRGVDVVESTAADCPTYWPAAALTPIR